MTPSPDDPLPWLSSARLDEPRRQLELSPGLLLDAALGAIPAVDQQAVDAALDSLTARPGGPGGALVAEWKAMVARGSSSPPAVDVMALADGPASSPPDGHDVGGLLAARGLRALLEGGDLAACRPVLDAALAASARTPLEPAVLAGLAWISWWEGDAVSARGRLARAASLLDGVGVPRTARVLVPVISAHTDPTGERFADPTGIAPDEAGADSTLGSFVRLQRVLEMTADAVGQQRWSDAGALLAGADFGTDRLGRARRDVLEAQCRHGLGEVDVAQALVGDAVIELDAVGARLAAIEARLVGAQFGGDQGTRWMAEADHLSDDSSLIDQLWHRQAELRIQVLGGFEVSGVDGDRTMSDRVAQLVAAVILADEAGVHWEVLASWLWPDEWDDKKLKSRVTSTTNLARKALGPDAWRLQREGPLLRFARRGLVVDLFEAGGSLPGEGVDLGARGGLLPAWSELEWVQDAAQRWGAPASA